MVVLLFPGQGAQSAGLLGPWLELPGVAARLARWSDLTGLDLAAAGTTWSAEAIRDTSVAQPLLAATALVSAEALLGDVLPAAVCGHSVGELAALAVAGVLGADEAVTLAALRGRAMAGAAASSPTGMAAVLGGDPDEVAAAADRHGLELATVNVAGQVVLGGPVTGLRALAAAAPPGARVRLLDVAGAFHTSAMASAQPAFADAVRALAGRPPRTVIVANRDGAVVTDAAEALGRLPQQLTSPVRFDYCLATLATLGVTAAVELAPGGTLTALAKRALPELELVAVRTPDDLPRARALLTPAGDHPSLPWRALAAPENGVVDPLCALGQRVAEGDPVAVVAGRSGASTVLAPITGTVTDWLVAPGDPVRAGQLLAVLA